MISRNLCWETAHTAHMPEVGLHLWELHDETAGLLIHWLPLHSKVYSTPALLQFHILKCFRLNAGEQHRGDDLQEENNQKFSQCMQGSHRSLFLLLGLGKALQSF